MAWGENRVNVVALIAFSASGRASFQPVFDQFVEVFSEREDVQRSSKRSTTSRVHRRTRPHDRLRTPKFRTLRNQEIQPDTPCGSARIACRLSLLNLDAVPEFGNAGLDGESDATASASENRCDDKNG